MREFGEGGGGGGQLGGGGWCSLGGGSGALERFWRSTFWHRARSCEGLARVEELGERSFGYLLGPQSRALIWGLSRETKLVGLLQTGRVQVARIRARRIAW